MLNQGGPGSKVTKREKVAYRRLRDVGMSPPAAAEVIGRSKSWAYKHDKEVYRANLTPPAGVGFRKHDMSPDKNLSEAVNFVIALSRDKSDKACDLLERFGCEFAFYLGELALFFANAKALESNKELAELFAGEPMEEALAKAPITAADILGVVPSLLDRRYSGETSTERWFWEPPRVRQWLSQLEEAYPELAEIPMSLDGERPTEQEPASA